MIASVLFVAGFLAIVAGVAVWLGPSGGLIVGGLLAAFAGWRLDVTKGTDGAG